MSKHNKDNENHKDFETAKKQLKGFFQPASQVEEPQFITTGHFFLDLAIGHGVSPEDTDFDISNIDLKNIGGYAKGKLVEISGNEGSGKSSLAYRAIGYAQKMGLKCAWIDAEQSFSHDLAKINDVDMDKLSVSKLLDLDDPDHIISAEEVFDRITDACEDGYKVIVLDSVAVLTTQAELDNYVADGGVGMGNLAQLMSKAVKQVVQYAAKYGVLVIMINQIREKIGILFGCLHGDSLVKFADGNVHPIKNVVEQKMQGPVLTLDRETNSIRSAKITDWHINGQLADDEKWIRFLVDGPGTKNGRLDFHCTSNHILLTSTGEEIAAEDVMVGDELMTYRQERILVDDVHRDLIGNKVELKLIPYPAKVLLKEEGSARAHRTKVKYDLSVGGNGTYLVGGSTGVVVHNSPETTPGGRALKFLSSLRIKMQKQTGEKGPIYIEDENGKKKLVGNYSYIYVLKNRFGKPVEGSLRIPIYYEPYFPTVDESVFDTGRALKLIKPRLGVFSWGDFKVKGRNEFIAEINKQNLLSKLVKEIKELAAKEKFILPPEVLNFKDEPITVDLSDANGMAKKIVGRGKTKDSTDKSGKLVES